MNIASANANLMLPFGAQVPLYIYPNIDVKRCLVFSEVTVVFRASIAVQASRQQSRQAMDFLNYFVRVFAPVTNKKARRKAGFC
jgi:hypothetical protein